MKLPGSAQAGLAKRLLEGLEWHRFQPHSDWASYKNDEVAPRPPWGRWIWFPEGEPAVAAPLATRYFRTSFELSQGAKPRSGLLWMAADDRCRAYVNGEGAGSR